MYITSIRLKTDHRCLPANLTIVPKDVTILVGDQGCGKSTILELLNQYGQTQSETPLEIQLTETAIKFGVTTYYFDTEKHNPRITNPILYTNIDGSNRGIGVGSAIQSRFTSHGETLRQFTVIPLLQAKNCIVFLDEPESALSLRNQYTLIKSIQTAENNGCQLFIATHCLPLIMAFKKVYSMEHHKWLTSKQFIKMQQS